MWNFATIVASTRGFALLILPRLLKRSRILKIPSISRAEEGVCLGLSIGLKLQKTEVSIQLNKTNAAAEPLST